jgi:hypothetical protein
LLAQETCWKALVDCEPSIVIAGLPMRRSGPVEPTATQNLRPAHDTSVGGEGRVDGLSVGAQL